MAIASQSPEQSIVNYGVSEQLKNEFDLLREVIGVNEYRKFSNATVDTLAQHVVCRHYGNLCYEFAHLNWALVFASTQNNTFKYSKDSIQKALIDYYWIGQITSTAKFSVYFEHLSNVEPIKQASSIFMLKTSKKEKICKTNLSDEPTLPPAITLHIHGHTFTINASRSNLLACFMEWLICVVPNLLLLIEEKLLGCGHTGIRDFSSLLQKHIYDYLSVHLPPAKLQQRYRLMQSWYKTDQGGEQSLVSDSTLLQFWQQHNSQEGYGKFSNVLKDSLSYQQALDIMQTGMLLQYAESSSVINDADLFNDNQAEPLSTSLFEAVSTFTGQHVIEVQLLTSSPKAISNQALELIDLACNYPQYIVPLSASWIRFLVFGKAQHQLIQLARMKKTSPQSTKEQAALIDLDYQQVTRACIELIANNQQTLLAIVNILFAEAPSKACLVLLKLMASLPQYEKHYSDFQQMLDEGTNVNINKSKLAQWQLGHRWFKQLCEQCQLAFKHINRQGFTHKTILDVPQYVSCAQGLFDVNKLMKQLLTNIKKKQQQSLINFDADRAIFLNEFSKLYLKDGSQDDN